MSQMNTEFSPEIVHLEEASARPATRVSVRSDASNVVEYVEKLNGAENAEAVWALHLEAMRGFGFERLMYGFTRFRTPNSFGDPQDCMILTNQPPEYTDVFVGQRLYTKSAIVEWAAENVGALSWSWIHENYDQLTPSEREVVDFNVKMGVTVGYSISFKAPSARFRGAISLSPAKGVSQAEVDALWKSSGREIHAMNNIMHMTIVQMPITTGRRPLTPRQRETLAWVGEGKTTQDIATIMGLTPATVEKHLRLAREALDVETTAQAVCKASMQNQIFAELY